MVRTETDRRRAGREKELSSEKMRRKEVQSTAQHITAHHSTAQHSTAEHSRAHIDSIIRTLNN